MAYLRQEANGGYTYSDYLTWPAGERWEIIEGFAHRLGQAQDIFGDS